MRFAFLRTDFGRTPAGGSVTHVTGTVNALTELGHSVTVLTSVVMGGVFAPSVEVHVLHHRPFLSGRETTAVWNSYNFVRRALPILRRAQPEVIYQRASQFNCAGWVLSRKLNMPFVLESNGSEWWKAKHWGGARHLSLIRLFEEVSLRGADVVTVISQQVWEDVVGKLGIPPAKVVVNPNAVDPRRFHPGVDGTAVRRELGLEGRISVGFVSSFDLWHGVEVLTRAIEPVVRACPEVVFVMVGDGRLRRRSEEYVQSHGLADHTIYTGLVAHERVPEYLAACDILVSPHVPNPDGTIFFGSPTKLFEYMAMAKPIVASRLGQIAEVLGNDRNAVLVEPGDVDDLARGILSLIDNPDRARALAHQARADALARHTWTHHAQRIVEAIERIASQKG